MFLSLLIVNFIVSSGVSLMVICFFSKSINAILGRIINDPIHSSWSKYVKFAGAVVGISSGVKVYDLEKYINPTTFVKGQQTILSLTKERWVLEIYKTIILTLQGLAWMLFVFFTFALISYVIVRVSEIRNQRKIN